MTKLKGAAGRAKMCVEVAWWKEDLFYIPRLIHSLSFAYELFFLLDTFGWFILDVNLCFMLCALVR